MKSPLPLLVLLVAFGCDDTLRGLETDAKEAVTATKKEAEEVRRDLATAQYSARSDLNDFMAKTNVELDAVSKKIERMKADARRAPGEAQESMNEQIRTLEARQEELERKTESLGDRASREWDDAKREISQSVASLGRDVDRALEQLGDSVREATN